MRTVTLKSGDKVPVLGLGTWRMGERRPERGPRWRRIRLGLDLGMTLIDTAEMYGDGGAEEVVAEAIAGRRDDLFIVSKVYPHNASRTGAIAACERSLKRLQDRPARPLPPALARLACRWRETVEAFEALQEGRQDPPLGRQQLRHRRHGGAGGRAGRRQLRGQPGALPPRLARRRVAALDACRKDKVMVMAYSPLGQGPLLRKPALRRSPASTASIPPPWRWPGCCASPA